MKTIVRSTVMLAALLATSLLQGAGQSSGAPGGVVLPESDKFDLGITYTYKMAKIATLSDSNFGLQGGAVDGVYWFGDRFKNLGLAFDISGETASNIKPGVNLKQFTLVAGPRYTLWKDKSRIHGANLFAEALGGYVHAFDGVFPGPSSAATSGNSFSVQTGGGVNLPIAKRIDLRLIQADYILTKLPNASNDVQSDLRLSAGLVFRFGVTAPKQLTVSCAATPAAVFAGEPVALTATAGGIDPKLHLLYSWTGSGAVGTDAMASVPTATLAPGNYTVNCGVKEGKPGKEGLQPWESASSTASFTVKAFEPPTVSCSATPTTLKPGESATVTALGVSPQNRPLTYSYKATAGTVSGAGQTASFKSAGAPAGSTQITCVVSDDKGHTVSANTAVTIVPPPPPPPPAPKTSALCSVAFDKDKRQPSRVDNEAKACLDEVALNLQKQPSAKIVIVGSADAKEKKVTAGQLKRAAKSKFVKVIDMAALRAVNAKEYLVKEKGIDAARVQVATSTVDNQKADNYLVPAGATFTNDVSGTTPVDESATKPVVRKSRAVRHASPQAAAKK